MNDVRTVLLSVAFVEELELIWVCCVWRVDIFLFFENKNKSTRHTHHTEISSNSSTIATDNSAGMYIIYYSI
jgi:hypothetical protein